MNNCTIYDSQVHVNVMDVVIYNELVLLKDGTSSCQVYTHTVVNLRCQADCTKRDEPKQTKNR